MKLLRIGFVLDDRLDKPDGVQQYVQLIGKWMSEQGHEVHYLVGESPGLTDEKVHHLSKTIKVRFNKNRMEIPLPASKRRIKKLLTEHPFDVLHVQMPYSPLLAARVIAAAPSKTAIVGTFHILPYSAAEQAATRALSFVLTRSRRKFDKIFSTSEPAAAFARKAFRVESDVSPNVVNLKNMIEGKPITKYKNRKNIVFLGRLVERKGARQALLAFQRLCESPAFARNNRLIICGDGPMRIELEQLADKVKQKARETEIEFTGFLTEKDKPDYLATADVAVFPATGGESFGIVLIEAMAARARVVLAGNNPGYSSVMADVPEVLFNPNDISEFSSLMARAAGDAEFAKDIHSAQIKLVKNFDVEVVGPKVEQVYRELIAAKTKTMHNRAR